MVFGSLGAVVAFLFWVYLSANILLLGAELVSEIPDVVAGRFDAPKPRTGPKRTDKQEGAASAAQPGHDAPKDDPRSTVARSDEPREPTNAIAGQLCDGWLR